LQGDAAPRRHPFFFAALALLATLGATPAVCQRAPRLAEGVLATVNGQTITVSEFEKAFAAARQTALEPAPNDPVDRLAVAQAFLDALIDKLLLEQEAARLGVQVDEAAIDQDVRRMMAGWPGKTFRREVAQQGVEPAWLREQARLSRLAVEVAARTVEPQAQVTEEELKSYYDAHPTEFQRPERAHVRQVLCKDQAQAAMTLAELLTGKDFAQVARERSQAPEAARGGDLGFVARGELPAEIEEAAFHQLVGEIGPLVESPFGVHIIQVVDRQPAATLTYEQARPTIERALRKRRIDQAWRQRLDELRRAAQIETDLRRLPR
jgi:parvulin-like peptidyl-prolyl isomerase